MLTRPLFAILATALALTTHSGPALARDDQAAAKDGSAFIPDIKGDWWGTLEAGGAKLRLVIHFTDADGDGVLEGTADSIDQAARGLALSDIVQTPEQLIDEHVVFPGISFNIPQVGGRYVGHWEEDHIFGLWSQGEAQLSLDLVPGLPEVAERPKPIIPENWQFPDGQQVLDRLAALIGDRDGVVGAVALVDSSGQRLLSSDGVDPSARFEIGSITKVFTSFLLADMVLNGEVALDDKAVKYLPEGSLGHGQASEITLRDLASHFSGLPRLPANLIPFAALPDPYAQYDDAMLLDFVQTVEPARAPGEGFEYSNAAVGLLGYILGQQAGSDYMTALKQRILDPMGLSDTDFSLDDRSVAGHAGAGEVAPWTFLSLAPTGALRSTIADMAKFAQIIATPPEQWARHVALMTSDQRETANGMSIGLGLFTIPLTKDGVLFHNGGTGGFKSSMWADPDTGRAVVVLVNASDSDPDKLGAYLISGVERR